MKKIVLIIFLLTTSFVFAFPPFEQYQQGNINIRIPQSWAVQADEANGTIYIVENANDPNSPGIFFATTANSNNLSPKEVIDETINDMINSGLSNYQVISSENLDGGLMLVFTGTMQNRVLKTGLVAFANQNAITLAVFSAEANRFDELGGIALLFVTVGGHDPAQYAATNPQNNKPQTSNAAMSAECTNPNDFLYDAEYCQYERLTLATQRQAVDISYLLGQWDFAMNFPSFDGAAWENIATGNVSYDSSGKGMSIVFHNNGTYDIIYLQSLSSGGYNSEVKAYEHGTFQYDGLVVRLTKTSFEGTISTLSGAPTSMVETGQRIQPSNIEAVFLNQAELFLQFNCNNRGYIIGCNNYGQYLFKLAKKQ